MYLVSVVLESSKSLTENCSTKLFSLVSSCYEGFSQDLKWYHYNRLKESISLDYELPGVKNLKSNDLSFSFADLFCGAGGLSLGFEIEGANCAYATDHDASAVKTFKINRPKLKVVCDDIKNILETKTSFETIPVVIGGPPCQGFSNANKQRKRNDDRNLLYQSFLKFADRSNAQIILIENVHGILSVWEKIKADLKSKGFISNYLDLEASDFGFPQRRRRVFIIGLKGCGQSEAENFFSELKENIFLENNSRSYNLGDAINGLPILSAKDIPNKTNLENERYGFSISAECNHANAYTNLINSHLGNGPLFNHRSKFNNPRDIEIYSCLKAGGGVVDDRFHSLNPYKNRDHIFKDKFFRLSDSNLSKTITAHMYYDCHMYVHPKQDRGLSPREAARIQGYPDQYLFLGKPNEWYRQIGNSVSPLVSRAIARALIPLIKNFIK